MVESVSLVPFQPQRRADEGGRRLGGGAERGRHPAALVVLDELAGQLLLHPLTLGAAGQQQVALHLHKVGRHLDKGAGNVRVHGLCGLHGAGVLVDQRKDGDVVQVHLVLRHQRQKQLQRPLELLQMKGKLLRHQITAPRDA